MNAMTIRESLNVRRRRASGLGLVGFCDLAISLLVNSSPESPPFSAFVGFALFASSVLYQLFALRCPHCRGNLGGPLSYGGTPLGISRQVRFCLYCGVELDTEGEKSNRSLAADAHKDARG